MIQLVQLSQRDRAAGWVTYGLSQCFGVIAAYCSNYGHCVFEPPFGRGGSGTTYDVYLGLIGNRVVDFLLVFIELFRSNAISLTENFR